MSIPPNPYQGRPIGRPPREQPQAPARGHAPGHSHPHSHPHGHACDAYMERFDTGALFPPEVLARMLAAVDPGLDQDFSDVDRPEAFLRGVLLALLHRDMMMGRRQDDHDYLTYLNALTSGYAAPLPQVSPRAPWHAVPPLIGALSELRSLACALLGTTEGRFDASPDARVAVAALDLAITAFREYAARTVPGLIPDSGDRVEAVMGDIANLRTAVAGFLGDAD